MCHNKSGRYESRFSTVKINPSKAIMFKDMDGSILGVWVAHAEGNLYFIYIFYNDGVIILFWCVNFDHTGIDISKH